MIKHGIDQEALITQFSEATAKQGAAVRKAVTEMTLKALQGRELTLANIRQVLNTVAAAAATGAGSNPLAPAGAETLLASAAAGMDAALPTVLGGLVPGVIIGVPTSVGYGVAAGGQAALHSMLSSCAPGMTVMNIDNGYGAACAALRVLRAIGST